MRGRNMKFVFDKVYFKVKLDSNLDVGRQLWFTEMMDSGVAIKCVFE